MDGFFQYDPLAADSKGLVFIGDDKTTTFLLSLDLPGGGPEDQDSIVISTVKMRGLVFKSEPRIIGAH